MSAPHISVVIPTYQRADSVERELQSLARQTLPADQFEVIVSVDGSNDGTEERVANFPAPYTLRQLWQPNRGRAAACNAGIRAANGEIVVLLDDDMEPNAECLATHERLHTDSLQLGVIGAASIPVAASSPPVMQYIGAKFNQHLARIGQPGYRLKLRDFYSGNFSIRRQMLCELGGFDEAFQVYGSEDLELGLRLTQAGIQIIFSPEAMAIQHYTKDFGALARDHIFKGQTSVLLARKHPQAWPELKLSTFDQASFKWRLLRSMLLALAATWPGSSERIIHMTQWLERRRPTWLPLYYAFVLDYFYWLGVDSAHAREQRNCSERALF